MKFKISNITIPIMLLSLAGCGSDHWAYRDIDWSARAVQADKHTADAEARVTPPADAAELPEDDPSEPLKVSLEQAVVSALRHNRALAVEQLSPPIAGTFVQQEQALYDPTFFAETSLSRDRTQSVSRATGSTFSTQGQDIDTVAGVRQSLPTGTELEATVSHTRTYSDRTPQQHDVRAGISLTQALLQGASPAANLVTIRQAKLDVQASDYELRGFTEALVAEVEDAYWDFALRHRGIEIVQTSLDLARQQLADSKQRVEVGQIAEIELAAAEAEIALREQELIDARAELDDARLRLLRLINPRGSLNWDRQVKLAETPAPIEARLEDVADHVRLGMIHRPDLNEARLRHEQDRLEVIRTRNGLLPRLDLFVTLGKTGFSASFSDSFNAWGDDTYDLLVGVRFEHLIGNRDAEARQQRAMLTRRQSAQSVDNLSQLVELDIRLAHIEAQRAARQIDASAATRRLRELTLAAEFEKFNVGKSTSFLIAQAQRDLLASQIAEVEAIVNLRKALTALYRLDGSLLARRGVQAPGSNIAMGNPAQ